MSYELPRILVCIDFSPYSDRAADEARQLARRMGAQIDFVHVAELQLDTPAARSALAALESSARSDGLVAKAHLAVGNPLHCILDFIQRLKPVVVVAGSHGQGAVMRLLVGSVAESLIRRSPVPVLVVPARGRLVPVERGAWSCGACNHLLGRDESTSRCVSCGAEPPQWVAAHALEAAR